MAKKMNRREMKQIKIYVEPEVAEQFRTILEENNESAQEHIEAFIKKFIKKHQK